MSRFFFVLAALIIPFGIMAEGPSFNPTPIHEAFITNVSDVVTPVWLPSSPPALRMKSPPAQPFTDAVWIPGYWAWVDSLNDFTWVCGVWRRPPPGFNWISGFWVNNQNGWAWSRGFWSQTPQDQFVIIPNAPPVSANDTVPASPGKNYFWAPGYWNYAPSSGQYTWLSGKWQAYNQNWILTPSCYIWRLNGYVFVPLFWDYPLDQRGNAYSCSGDNAPIVIIEPALIISNCYLYYPDYITVYSWWWFYNPGYWSDCGCLPPWWFWSDWWTFSWDDCWDLWWWWGDLDDFPPFWIVFEISAALEGPSDFMIEFMKNNHTPHFPRHSGTTPLRPTGHGHTRIPRPNIPVTVTPGGTITLPTIPGTSSGGSITVPTPPTTNYNPPQTTYYPPSGNYNPPTTYNPPNRNYNPPTTYNPPNGNYTPPSRGGYTHNPSKGSGSYGSGTSGGGSHGHGGGTQDSGSNTPSRGSGTTSQQTRTIKS